MLRKMKKDQRRKGGKCLLCCMSGRDSDDENFLEIPSSPTAERVIEEGETESPFISTGNLSIASHDTVGLKPPPEANEESGFHRGDAAVDSDITQYSTKVVHFAMCHEPDMKDTRGHYRHTPIKQKPELPFCQEECVFVKSTIDSDYVKVPISSFKKYVTGYVQDIVDSAVESIIEEERQAVSMYDLRLEALSVNSDDGVEVDFQDEDAVISDMIDQILSNVVQAMAEELAGLRTPNACMSTESNTSCSTDTGESVTPSLDWDGYEPLLLREDPSSTDISLRYPEVSAGKDL